jgi:hypothetical protein
MKKEYKYRAICWKVCYWKENLWQIGDIYEGDDPPGKWFSDDGESPGPETAKSPADDPRNNVQLREFLISHNVKMPKNASRKVLWNRVRDIENAEGLDAQTAPEKPRKSNMKVTKAKRKTKKPITIL